ncbi:sigma-70 family RNA polymerase sigma factor [Candidatus Saccharibacteria bacterium]|nr:sigma-70 family RNA polymerase sigma factor [Candidatus Saccharibacteria bacterium]
MEFEDEAEANGREELFAPILQRYKEHPQVGAALNRIKNNSKVLKDPENLIGRYFQEVGQYNLLNELDEQRLFGVIENGLEVYRRTGTLEGLSPEDEQALINLVIAHQTIYVSNLRLVIDIAQRYFYLKIMQPEDLVQEGNVGLSIAIKKFNIGKGYKLSTYATWWIRQSITRAIGDKSRAIRIPVHMHEKWIKLVPALKELDDKLGREPTREEIAEHMGESLKTIHLLMARGSGELASLDEPITEEGGTLQDVLENPVSPIDMRMEELDSRAYVTRMFSAPALKLREQFILSARLGYSVDFLRGTKLTIGNGSSVSYEDIISAMENSDDGTLTLEEVGELFGVTRERIRQVESDGFKKIREGYYKR